MTKANDSGSRVSYFFFCSLGPGPGSREVGGSGIFPTLDCYGGGSLPMSHAVFVRMLAVLGLPDATPIILQSDSTHFQRSEMGRTDEELQGIGVAMRLVSRGVLESDMTASIAYQPATGTVNAFLHGCTSEQQAEVGRQLKALSPLARHPLLLPVILAEMRLDAINKWREYMWRFLLYVETRSGQTGAPALDALERPVLKYSGEEDWGELAVDALTVMQIAATMEDHANGLRLVLVEMQNMLNGLEQEVPPNQSLSMLQSGRLLSGKIRSLSHAVDVTLSQLQYLIKRGEAQQSAVRVVYNYTAQQDTRTQRLMALQSGQIAEASKRDSSVMKGIAILTMVFLPATFMASISLTHWRFYTFFAMPILDFGADSRLPDVKGAFWLYWAVTLPMTFFILGGYAMFLRLFPT
ncbi:hypothetical protein B0T16DRAFT_336990 [Cercophora newfieldiana]|uniref:Uncharacterized protein n=1 Tax=Cercophora newfieldiana TaxID=92897 RepID=A0AA40CJK7_9PEZI|nr:hypothetical protein B0T16DRAFT_336990 [Cercophora newfieldiana]